jgi:hypothetical protein
MSQWTLPHLLTHVQVASHEFRDVHVITDQCDNRHFDQPEPIWQVRLKLRLTHEPLLTNHQQL